MLEVPGYRIEGEAGRGGWSVVYRAIQLSTSRVVALKVMSADLAGGPGFRERFRRECEVAMSLQHPNLLTVYDQGEAGGRPWVAMQWVDGTDLATLAPLDPARAARIVAQIGAALDAVHARGLVHRDVKPANVLVDRGGHAYLTDFGLAKEISADPGLTEAGRWLGTADFAAPEQIRGQPTDARSDVYSLGCVLGFAVTGAVPYPRGTPAETMEAHLREEPPRTGGPLDPVLARALAKNPEWRFQSAGELGRAVQTVASTRRSGDRRKTIIGATLIAAWMATSIAVGLIAVIDSDDGVETEPAPSEPAPVPPAPGGEIELLPVRGGDAYGWAYVVQDSGRPALEVDAHAEPAPRGRTYEVWLYNGRRDAVSLGTTIESRGKLLTKRRLPDDFADYAYVDISLEPDDGDTRHDGRSVLRGQLR